MDDGGLNLFGSTNGSKDPNLDTTDDDQEEEEVH
jgi:hypothetical protein